MKLIEEFFDVFELMMLIVTRLKTLFEISICKLNLKRITNNINKDIINQN